MLTSGGHELNGSFYHVSCFLTWFLGNGFSPKFSPFSPSPHRSESSALFASGCILECWSALPSLGSRAHPREMTVSLHQGPRKGGGMSSSAQTRNRPASWARCLLVVMQSNTTNNLMKTVHSDFPALAHIPFFPPIILKNAAK